MSMWIKVERKVSTFFCLLFLHNFFTKFAKEKQQMDTKDGYNKNTIKRGE